MNTPLALLFGAFLFCSFLLLPAFSLSCGRVFSGPPFDAGHNRAQQVAEARLQANWNGFASNGGSGKVTYACAAISGKLKTQAITDSGPFAVDSKRCRATTGLAPNAEPDLVDFTFCNLGTNTSVRLRHQPLEIGGIYYIIIRATQGNQVTYSNTNSIFVKDNDDDDLAPYEQGLIAMGCAIFCLLCLALLLLLLVVAKLSRGDDKYTTTVHRNENVDKL